MATDPREIAAVRVARALADPMRFRLLRTIAGRIEVSCRDLTALFPITQATVSHHLKVLSQAGLVLVRREGSFHYYRAARSALAAHGRVLEAFARPPRSRKEHSP